MSIQSAVWVLLKLRFYNKWRLFQSSQVSIKTPKFSFSDLVRVKPITNEIIIVSVQCVAYFWNETAKSKLIPDGNLGHCWTSNTFDSLENSLGIERIIGMNTEITSILIALLSYIVEDTDRAFLIFFVAIKFLWDIFRLLTLIYNTSSKLKFTMKN